MRVLRVSGWLLIAAGAAALVHDLWGWTAAEPLRLAALGELWFKIDRAGLNLAQAAIQRHVWPALWDPGIVTVLLLPAVLACWIAGGVLLGLGSLGGGEGGGRRRRRRAGGLEA
mgnify:CR=1 FL=1